MLNVWTRKSNVRFSGDPQSEAAELKSFWLGAYRIESLDGSDAPKPRGRFFRFFPGGGTQGTNHLFVRNIFDRETGRRIDCVLVSDTEMGPLLEARQVPTEEECRLLPALEANVPEWLRDRWIYRIVVFPPEDVLLVLRNATAALA